MADYVLTHTGAELDEAIAKVQGDYADVSEVGATVADVRQGVRFVGADKQLHTGALVPGGGAEITQDSDTLFIR